VSKLYKGAYLCAVWVLVRPIVGKTGQNIENKPKRAMAKERKLNSPISSEKKAKKPVKKHVKTVAGHELDNTPSSGMSGQSDSANTGPDSEININIGDIKDKGPDTVGPISPIKKSSKWML